MLGENNEVLLQKEFIVLKGFNRDKLVRNWEVYNHKTSKKLYKYRNILFLEYILTTFKFSIEFKDFDTQLQKMHYGHGLYEKEKQVFHTTEQFLKNDVGSYQNIEE